MLFKRLHKQPDKDIQEHPEGNEGPQVEHTEEELEAHLQKLMKRQRRIVRLKKAVLYLIIGIGLLGGFRSLAQERPDITPAVAVNDYSFLEDYIKTIINIRRMKKVSSSYRNSRPEEAGTYPMIKRSRVPR